MSLEATEIYARFASEVHDDFGEVDTNQLYYRKEHADEAMDKLKVRIEELVKAKREILTRNVELIGENAQLTMKIKELESDLETMEVSYEALIRNTVNIAKDTELRLRYRIGELEEQCTKYQAELMNNDPALTSTTEET